MAQQGDERNLGLLAADVVSPRLIQRWLERERCGP
jgi:hypothetical protein